MTALEATNAEIRRRLRDERQLREERRRADQPVRIIDALLAELEELHLEGRKRVPESYDRRLAELIASLPADCRLELRSRITIVHLMDRLYAIQDGLLTRRHPRATAQTDEDSLPQAS